MEKPTTMFTMKMDSELHKNLKRKAADSGQTMGDLIIQGLAAINIVAEEGKADEKNSNSK